MQVPNDRMYLVEMLMQSLAAHVPQAIMAENDSAFRAALAEQLRAHADAIAPVVHKAIGFIRPQEVEQ